MPSHCHRFVEDYQGLIGFGFDRTTDEATVKVYLQKFSDDDLLKAIVPRLTDQELSQIFDLISQLLARRLSRNEYEELFLKQN
ncbi:MAG: cytoplasmic protein [Deltaproteobacteria bacterium]|nr:cytoplasmic protein [Deltaproteobacteria bacterium]